MPPRCALRTAICCRAKPWPRSRSAMVICCGCFRARDASSRWLAPSANASALIPSPSSSWCRPPLKTLPRFGGCGRRRSSSSAMRDARHSSFRFRAESRAERMNGIDADDPEFTGEEFELLQRKRQVAVLRMAVDIGVKLGGEEIAVHHVALQLGHVDAVGGEPAHGLIE